MHNPLTSHIVLLSLAAALMLLFLLWIRTAMRTDQSKMIRDQRMRGIAGLMGCGLLLWLGYATAFERALQGAGAWRAAAIAWVTTVLAWQVFRNAVRQFHGSRRRQE